MINQKASEILHFKLIIKLFCKRKKVVGFSVSLIQSLDPLRNTGNTMYFFLAMEWYHQGSVFLTFSVHLSPGNMNIADFYKQFKVPTWIVMACFN